MRAINLFSMVAVLACIAPGLPCWGQAASSDKLPQALTGPNGKDTGGEKPDAKKPEPKRQAVTKSDVKGRVNALSPEEKNRAARARERAAAKAAPKEAAAEAAKSGASKTAAPSAPSQNPATPASQSTAAAAKPPVAQATSRPRVASTANVKDRSRVRSRRASTIAGGRWTPRVGAVVPRGVPLYPVPPGYRPGQVYGMRPPWQYMPRPYYSPNPQVGLAYPPFPRSRSYFDDDED